MRILIIGHTARLSGAELELVALVPALTPSAEIHVLLAEEGPLVDALRTAGATVTVLLFPEHARGLSREDVRPGLLALRALPATFLYGLRLVRHIKRTRPDLVVTNTLKAHLYGAVAGRLTATPVVWQLHDIIAEPYLPAAAVHLVRLFARLFPRKIIANSRSTLASVSVPARRGVVVGSAVRMPKIRVHAVRPQVERVMMVGRISPWKGQHVFLSAFAEAFTGSEVAVVVGAALFGEEAYQVELVSLAKRLGISERVVFRGFQEDVYAELGTADIAVHCSISPEPFGRGIIEAMSVGVPVVAADAGGPAEIISPNQDGLLTPPDDVDGLAQALRALKEDRELRRRLSTNALATARAYDVKHISPVIIDIFQSCAAGRADTTDLRDRVDLREGGSTRPAPSATEYASTEAGEVTPVEGG